MPGHWHRFEPKSARFVSSSETNPFTRIADLDSVPPNVKFMVDDAEDSWVFSKQFDLIHARLMAGSFADWPFFFSEAYK